MHLVNDEKRQYKKLEIAILLFFFIWLLWCCFFGERIPENNGIGFDGTTYATLAVQFPALVFHHQLPIYAIQRVLPSGIIYYFSKLFHLSAQYEQMPFIFSIYNTLVLAVGVFFWHKIASFLQWNGAVRIVSFCGLFFSYSVLKMNTYDPVLTDMSAFVCGLGMLYFYLTDRKLGLLLLTIAGTFIYPTLMGMGLLLFVFLNKDQTKAFVRVVDNKFVTMALALAGTVCFTAIVAAIYWYIGEQDGFALGRYTRFPVIYLSFLAVFFYFYMAFYPIVKNGKQTVGTVFRQALSYRLIIAVVLGIILKIVILLLATKHAGALTPLLFLKVVTIRSVAYPFIFLVSYIIYYGPVACLIIFFWRDIIRNLKERTDMGLFVVVALYSLLFINTEARQISNFIPIIVIGVSQILNRKIIPPSFIFSFVVLGLLLSRFWLPLSHGWASLLTNQPQVTLEFPMQWFFMSQAPWMSNTMYVIFLTVSLVTLFVTGRMIKTLKPAL